MRGELRDGAKPNTYPSAYTDSDTNAGSVTNPHTNAGPDRWHRCLRIREWRNVQRNANN
jgi:hypothetical protein